MLKNNKCLLVVISEYKSNNLNIDEFDNDKIILITIKSDANNNDNHTSDVNKKCIYNINTFINMVAIVII